MIDSEKLCDKLFHKLKSINSKSKRFCTIMAYVFISLLKY